jgi:hypothetical protein
MLAAYQLDRAQRNLAGYAVLGVPRPLGVRTLRGLGAAVPITAADAFQKALSMYSGQHVNPRDSGNQAWVSAQVAEVQAGQFDVSASVPGCSAQAPNLNLFSTVSGLSLSAARTGIGIATAVSAIAGTTAVALGAATMGAGLVIAVIGMIFAHHAAAVKRDTNFSCGALPAVNNAFQLINQAVQSGHTSPAAAAAALPEIYSQFMKAGGGSGSITGPGGIPSSGNAINNHPWCNSNCEFSVTLLAMVLFWQAQYLAMADQQAAAPAPAPFPVPNLVAPVPNLVAPQPAPFVSSGSKLTIPARAAAPISSGPNWLMLAALIAGGFALAKAF